ncbi:MAG: penicillin acylase [Chitinophagaceae bacterium]|nr:penicillin acylase [Chitinophagaceae bacterium]
MNRTLLFSLFLFCCYYSSSACSILLYVDPTTGKVYAVNNEDYWLDEKAYLKIIPAGNQQLARLWYGWDNFAQGGINAAGLFFDGAATPTQPLAKGYHLPKNNLGDAILANCKNVDEALDYLEKEKIALTTGHMLFGDGNGNGVVVEWINGEKRITTRKDNYLMMTNYLINDTTAGNYPCQRHIAMLKQIEHIEQNSELVDLKTIGGVLAHAVQIPVKNSKGRKSGTLYSSFFDITDMRMTLVYQLDNSRKITLDLKQEFEKPTSQTIRFADIAPNRL